MYIFPTKYIFHIICSGSSSCTSAKIFSYICNVRYVKRCIDINGRQKVMNYAGTRWALRLRPREKAKIRIRSMCMYVGMHVSKDHWEPHSLISHSFFYSFFFLFITQPRGTLYGKWLLCVMSRTKGIGRRELKDRKYNWKRVGQKKNSHSYISPITYLLLCMYLYVYIHSSLALSLFTWFEMMVWMLLLNCV